MILVIDNYDSFVYNLARYFEKLNQQTLVVRNDKISISDINNLNPSHVVISPGPCTPNEAGISLDVIKYFHTRIPILGVCLGHQAIGQFFGATVTKAKEPMHGKASIIKHNQHNIFANIPNNIHVGRYHSLIVENIDLASELIVTATSSSGEIMGLAHKNLPIYGVQFHPESILTEHGESMINNFITI